MKIESQINNIVYSRTNMYPLSYTIQERQLKFLGHSLRRPADHIVSVYGLYCPHMVDQAEASPQPFTQNTFPRSCIRPSPSPPKKSEEQPVIDLGGGAKL